MPPFHFEHGRFTFRFEQLPSQRLRAWVEVPGLLQLGPITLNKAEADELGVLLERLMNVFVRAHGRGENESATTSKHSRRPAPDRKDGSVQAPPQRSSKQPSTSKAPSLQAPQRARKRRPN